MAHHIYSCIVLTLLYSFLPAATSKTAEISKSSSNTTEIHTLINKKTVATSKTVDVSTNTAEIHLPQLNVDNNKIDSTETPESPFNTIGIRIAMDSETSANLTSYELYQTSTPLWSWNLSEKVNTGIGYETSIGALIGEGETSAYIHFGFTLELTHKDLPVSLVLATGPSLYSEDTFKDLDLGTNIQFTSSAGVKWQVSENWSLEYRFQHTSNASIDDQNPGLNMHALGLSRSF